VSLVLALRVQGLGLDGPGLGLGLEGPGLGLVLGLWILALTTTLFITNIAASLKASTFVCMKHANLLSGVHNKSLQGR